MSVEIQPNVLKRNGYGQWVLDIPMAHSGGGLLAVTAEWCSHCNTLKNTVPKAQTLNPFDFYWMNGEKTPMHEQKSQEMGVEGYPTMYSIKRNGVLEEYRGGRSANDLASSFSRR